VTGSRGADVSDADVSVVGASVVATADVGDVVAGVVAGVVSVVATVSAGAAAGESVLAESLSPDDEHAPVRPNTRNAAAPLVTRRTARR
jgi:hypothetical protein